MYGDSSLGLFAGCLSGAEQGSGLGSPCSSLLDHPNPFCLFDLQCPQQSFPSVSVHPVPAATLPVAVMMFSSTELHLFAAMSAGGLCVCCPVIQDSDLVKIWEASPSQPLAVATHVSLSLGEACEKCSDPGSSSFAWFSHGRDDPVPCAWALFGWGVFLFTSQPAGKAFLSYSRLLAGLWARWAGCPLQN